MSFVDPATVIAGEFVDENDWNTLVGDMMYLKSNLNPPGVVLPYGGTAAPTGYLLCDGAAVSRTTYATLFSILSTTYGVGNGSTTFNLPDLRQRLPLGKAASGTGSTLGGAGGLKDAITVTHSHTQDPHTHTQNGHNHTQDSHAHAADDNQIPDHVHHAPGNQFVFERGQVESQRIPDGGSTSNGVYVTYSPNTLGGGTHNHDITVSGFTATNQSFTAVNQNGTATNQTAGSSGTDANLPPYLVLNFIIKT